VSDDRPDPHILDALDRRIELVSMDRFCDQITIALYGAGDGLAAIVHSYSPRPGVPDRLAWVAQAMRVLAGMSGVERSVAFECGAWHERAVRRAFLEACKADPAQPVAPRPLEVFDTRTNQAVAATSLGGGAWRVTSVAAVGAAASRASSVAAGLVKLMDVEADSADDRVIRLPCGAPHERLVGLLLPRAINVRAALREQEQAAGRGVLVAPSAQEAAS
jgi:hypothetical protein